MVDSKILFNCWVGYVRKRDVSVSQKCGNYCSLLKISKE
ncbi:hypothetical protein LEP1GSC072_2230 [Leptospira noguchii str. Bonito]|nr:hypothetical protein LEP1GSC072_2230 [Leptospira noguchii str. Bonito]